MRRGTCASFVGGLWILVSLACDPASNTQTANPTLRLMAAADLQALPAQAPDWRFAYGDWWRRARFSRTTSWWPWQARVIARRSNNVHSHTS